MVPREAASGEGSRDVWNGKERYRIKVGGKERAIYRRKSDSNKRFNQRIQKLRKQALAENGYHVRMTPADICDFYRNRNADELSKSSRDNYERLVRLHIRETPRLAKIDALELGPLLIEAEYDWLVRNDRTPATIKKIHSLCSTAFKYAQRYEMVDRNPFELAKTPKHKIKERAFLTGPEIVAFLEAAENHPLYAMLFVALATGARAQELFDLEWPDVDLKKKSILFRGTKTVNANRSVLINKKCVDVLKQARGNRVGGLVFIDEHGNKLDRFKANHRIEQIINRTDINKHITMHSLRHSAAFVALAQLPQAAILERFGWSEMPETYKHRVAEAQKIASGGIEKLI